MYHKFRGKFKVNLEFVLALLKYLQWAINHTVTSYFESRYLKQIARRGPGTRIFLIKTLLQYYNNNVIVHTNRALLNFSHNALVYYDIIIIMSDIQSRSLLQKLSQYMNPRTSKSLLQIAN